MALHQVAYNRKWKQYDPHLSGKWNILTKTIVNVALHLVQSNQIDSKSEKLEIQLICQIYNDLIHKKISSTDY